MKYLQNLLLVAAVIMVYYTILGNDFLYFWDDQWVVMNHYTEGGFNFSNIWAIFTEFFHGQYAPLNELLYLILYSFFDYNPFYFHLASLLLHAFNVLLVFHGLKLLLQLSVEIETKHISAISFFAALLFAVHPFNVESVAWMSASKILVYSFFYLLATYSFLLYIKHKKYRYYIFSVLLFVCSFFGKEQAVTFPLWVLLIYWCTGHSFKTRSVWVSTIPLFALSLLFGIITMLSQAATGSGALSNELSYPVWQRIVYAGYAFVEYVLKCVFPFKLSYLYPFPSVVGDPLPLWLLFYPMFIAIALVVFGKYIIKNKVLLFSLLFFIIHIAVALHIIPLSRFAVVADRYAYIASIGVCFSISFGIVYLFNKYKKVGKIFVSVLFACYVLYLGIYANARTRVWYDTDTLKEEIRHILKQREDYKSKKPVNDNESEIYDNTVF
jgi:hypothetical protein